MTAIRLEKAWKIWPIGHVFPAMPAGQASMLVARGIASEQKGDQAPRPAGFTSPANRMIAPDQMQRKKKA